MTDTMLVATYNVHKCVGAGGSFSPARVAAVIAEVGADVVAVQEADERFGARQGLLDEADLARRAGMRLLCQSDVPGGHGWHGNAILVRHMPLAYERRRIDLPGLEPRGAVVADLDMGKGRFRLVAAHLGLLAHSRTRQAAAILGALAEAEPLPTILLGDLNEWRARATALAVLEPLFGRSTRRATFPARLPILPLDRILGWPMGVVGPAQVHDTPLARRASDHLPLKAAVRLSAGAMLQDAAWAA
jgi:endonuclease/exonuclease/phosphatase family metal-dependent hydrolase